MRRPSSGRRAFTLVEILTVIAIIGVLIGMLVTVGPMVMGYVKSARIKAEIAQLEIALDRVRNELLGGEWPPDGSNAQDTTRCIKQAFPQAGAAAPAGLSSPADALVFWLGGARDANGNFIGFDKNPQDPFGNSTSRIGPFFDFDRARVSGAATGWGSRSYYCENGNPVPAAVANGEYHPYLYFKAIGGVYAGTWNGITPYYDSKAMKTATQGAISAVWMNPNSFQILAPGLDGKYTPTTDGKPGLYPEGSNYGKKTGDDVTNFSKGRLSNDQP